MVGSLEGTIELKSEKFLIVKSGGLGFKVFLGQETLKSVPEKGANVKLWTHLYVRENALELYGFLGAEELTFFETLIELPGIGPKSALGILGVASIATLRSAIAAGDTSYLTKVSGIGRKTAEKIVIELKEKMAGRGVLLSSPELKEEADTLDALIALGYSQREAREALVAIPAGTKGAKNRVREALKRLGGQR